MWLIACCVLFCVLYFILIGVFFVGWVRIPDFEPKGEDFAPVCISVVVACKNEELHLPQLLASLVRQSYVNFELILVNDHSTDRTGELMTNVLGFNMPVICVQAAGHGKKNALREGIIRAKGDIIVTTDADCIPTTTWIETIVRFQAFSPSDLIICPVGMTVDSSVFSRLQAIEFTSLIASGAGAAGSGMPILCNGANLAFTRDAWLRSQGDLHENEQSGDDIFLLQSIKKRGGVIRFLKSESAFVTTSSSKTGKEFFAQRRRWASKSPAYTDWQIIATACVVFVMSVLLFFLFVLSVFGIVCWSLFLFVFIFKYMLDALFLTLVRPFFQLHQVWILSLILSVFYPVYISSVALSALLLKPVSWK